MQENTKQKNRKNSDKAKQTPRQNFTRNNNQKNTQKNKGHVYGVIDLGTNNCRLLVAVPSAHGFRVIDAFSRIVRLGEGLNRDKNISEPAIERTISALKICVDKMKRRGVTRMWNVATQACREAENCDDFVKAVEQHVDIKLDIIDAKEEARLAVMGCRALLDCNYNRSIVFDIGGGSTEIIWVQYDEKRKLDIIDWISIPLGVVNLSEEYGTKEALSTAHYQEMKNRIKEYILPFEEKHNIKASIDQNKVQLMGASGTVTTLTSMHLNQAVYDRTEVDGAWIKSINLVNLCNDLSKMDYKERLALNNIGNDRAELVVAGCAILDAIIEVWPIDNVRVADRGIREGMLHDLMEKQRHINKSNRRKRSRQKYYANKKAQKKSNAENGTPINS